MVHALVLGLAVALIGCPPAPDPEGGGGGGGGGAAGGTGGSAGVGGSAGGGGVGLEGCGPRSQLFADGDFPEEAWSYVEAAGEGIRTIDSVTTEMMDGNDGAYRRVEVTVTATMTEQAGITVAHALDGALYDPGTEGAICGIRLSLDGTDQFDQPQRSSFFSVYLFQNDTYYRALPTLEVDTEQWETGTWSTEDFSKFVGPGPSLPDLSASGAAIQFGFLTASSRPTTAPGSGTTVAGADNFRVEIFAP
jgi:hypothetical protein